MSVRLDFDPMAVDLPKQPPKPTKPELEAARAVPPPPPPPPLAKLENPERAADGTFKPGHSFALGAKGPRILPTPQDVLDAGEDYLNHCIANPLLVERTKLHDGKVVTYTEKTTRIPTLTGFAVFVGCSAESFRKWTLHHNEEYAAAAMAVREAILGNQLELGAARVTDPAFTARLAGLADKSEQAVTLTPVANSVDPLDVPNCVHPHDPDPLAPDRLKFSQRQIEAGIEYPLKTVN